MRIGKHGITISTSKPDAMLNVMLFNLCAITVLMVLVVASLWLSALDKVALVWLVVVDIPAIAVYLMVLFAKEVDLKPEPEPEYMYVDFADGTVRRCPVTWVNGIPTTPRLSDPAWEVVDE